MAQAGFPTSWFVEMDGRRIGPFSPEHILGLVSDGEIPESIRVIPAEAGAESAISAQQLREAYFKEDRIPTAPVLTEATAQDIPFAPDLPEGEEETREIQVANELATTRRLFDLFQSAREKRAARFAPNAPASSHDSGALGGLTHPFAAAAAILAVVTASYLGLSGSGRQSQGDREIAQVSPKEAASQAMQSAQKETAAAAIAETVAVPAAAPKPKATLSSTWKPGKSAVKTVARPAPPPRPVARPDDREAERRDERDDRRDERDERNLDQWNQAQDPMQANNGQPNGQPAAPLLNQMANEANPANLDPAAIQPPPGMVMGPDGIPIPQEAPQAMGTPPGPNDTPFNQ